MKRSCFGCVRIADFFITLEQAISWGLRMAEGKCLGFVGEMPPLGINRSDRLDRYLEQEAVAQMLDPTSEAVVR